MRNGESAGASSDEKNHGRPSQPVKRRPGRPRRSEAIKKLTLIAPLPMHDRLSQMATARKVAVVEVIRRAIITFDTIDKLSERFPDATLELVGPNDTYRIPVLAPTGYDAI